MFKATFEKILTVPSQSQAPCEAQTRTCFPTLFLRFSLIMTLLTVICVALQSYWIHESINGYLSESLEIEELSNDIRGLDASLTYAATIYAATADQKWRDNYNADAVKLDHTITVMNDRYPDQEDDNDSVATIRNAREALKAMDEKVFSMVAVGSIHEAEHMLSSRQYIEAKQAYSDGLYEFYEEVEHAIHARLKNLSYQAYSTLYLALGALAVLAVVWLLAFRSLSQWRAELEEARNTLSARYDEKERMELQMNSYVAEIRAAHARAMQAAESAEKASYAKSEFLANMSHELRTPMNGIIGMADMLEDTGLSSEQAEYNEILRSSAKSLLLIVNDILDLSKIEAGSMELELEPFPLTKAIADTAELFMSVASKRGIVLSLYIASDLPRFVEGDEGRFVQVIRNLIGNAIKFTDEGSVHVGASMDGGDLLLSVRDTGIGIEDDHRDHIFGKFNQANASTTRRYGGTGLGLAICKQLIEMMGGNIGVESELKKGSTFWFKIPLKVRDDIDHIMERFVPGGDMPQLKLPKTKFSFNPDAQILLTEDHPTNQFLMKRLLGKLGFKNVDTAENGKEALEAFEHKSYDLILMDCQMPEMDGYEATGWIRRLEHDDKHVPIIAMTANAMVGDRDKCLDCGMDDYISKPVDASVFSQTLARWLPGDGAINDIERREDAKSDNVSNDNGVVNTEHLEMFTDGDPEVERELFALFSEQALLALERLEKACDDTAFEEWRSAAHKFKGAAANLGAEKLSALCSVAEKGFEGDQSSKTEFLSAIRVGFQDVQRFLDQRTGQ